MDNWDRLNKILETIRAAVTADEIKGFIARASAQEAIAFLHKLKAKMAAYEPIYAAQSAARASEAAASGRRSSVSSSAKAKPVQSAPLTVFSASSSSIRKQAGKESLGTASRRPSMAASAKILQQ